MKSLNEALPPSEEIVDETDDEEENVSLSTSEKDEEANQMKRRLDQSEEGGPSGIAKTPKRSSLLSYFMKHRHILYTLFSLDFTPLVQIHISNKSK